MFIWQDVLHFLLNPLLVSGGGMIHGDVQPPPKLHLPTRNDQECSNHQVNSRPGVHNGKFPGISGGLGGFRGLGNGNTPGN